MIRQFTKTASLALLLFATAAAGMAQTNPNRLLVKTATGPKGYLVERVEDLSFAKVEGEVKASVEVLSIGEGELTVNVQRSEACQAFRLALFPKNIVEAYDGNPEHLINKVEAEGTELLYQDFPEGKLSGIELEPSTSYSVVTVGYDQYEIPCGISRADFRTSNPDIVGNPMVNTSITDVGNYGFTVNCKPNADVAGYAVVTGEKGLCQMYCTAFGFANFGDLVKAWGLTVEPAADFSHTWNDMGPDMDYEVFVQAWDANGNFIDCDTIPVHTLAKGGEGAAVVDIQLGEYKLQDWWGEMLPSQFITFTPNDQTGAYRYTVCYAQDHGELQGYDGHEEETLAELCSEPPMAGMAYWFNYEPLTTDFQIDPNSECVAIAVGKNGKNEWGEPTIVRFTTPAKAASAPAFAPSASVVRPSCGVRSLPNRVSPSSVVKDNGGMVRRGMKPHRITLR